MDDIIIALKGSKLENLVYLNWLNMIIVVIHYRVFVYSCIHSCPPIANWNRIRDCRNRDIKDSQIFDVSQ